MYFNKYDDNHNIIKVKILLFLNMAHHFHQIIRAVIEKLKIVTSIV